MNTYIYQSALLCEDCAEQTKEHLRHANAAYRVFDSETWPQGPYADGGGESDSPQHCDHCRTFLENPLTTDGEEWLLENAREDHEAFMEGKGVWGEWSAFYAYLFPREEHTPSGCEAAYLMVE